MLSDLIKSKEFGGNYNLINESVRSGVPTAVFGLSSPEKVALISALKSPILYIVRDGIQAQKFLYDITSITNLKCVFLSAKDDLLLYKSTFNKESTFKRLCAIYEIQKGADIVITTFEALLTLFPKNLNVIKLEEGCEYDLYNLVSKLTNVGYKRVDFCEKKGEFSLRGDILEVFPINSEELIRFNFFGDELEKIKTESSLILKDFEILQATDVLIESDEVPSILNSLKNAYKDFGTLLSKNQAKNLYSKIAEKLEVDLLDDSLQYIFPLIKNKTNNVFDFLSEDVTIVYDESKIIHSTLLNLEKEHQERCASIIKSGEGLGFIKEQMISSNTLLRFFEGKKCLAVQTLSSVIPFFNPLKTFNVTSAPVSKYWLKIDTLYQDIVNWQLNNYAVVLCLPDKNSAKSVYFDLTKKGLSIHFKDEINEEIGKITITVCRLSNGFIKHDSKLVIVGANDLTSKKPKDKSIAKKRGNLFTAPNVGDFAVHDRFGIGLVKGVKKISTIEGTSAYVELEYLGGDRLYVPTDQMDKLSKYLGGAETPTLNRLGGGEFERIKERVRQSIAKMTINLKKLYAQRKERKGFEFSCDNAFTEEFENSFEYEETEDQLISVNEIKEDMESAKVMDRLLCGDVGFGKTEVAFRACFKAVLDGKQAAIVAPTTILTEQHYMTAKSRFKDFGIRIAVLNRFRSKKIQDKIISDIKNGDVDIVIGTHRLFSKDVKFKDLGLLVIDEEQRFGVEHKEKLKLLKENVDTLTLTATPIPRTLHLSLSGIRDISTINTPPKERIPVQTVVTELTDTLIKEAVTKELSRNGQVFILYNKVKSIYNFAERVKGLVKEANIIVAHGQMKEKELENNISAFYRGEGNVLIATTIIENGIDMPRANTLIVEGSDALGLSTLYQLKGRVGRGNLLAYAYFTYSEGKVLTDEGYKRLQALMEYTEMGSGYKIAMRDLEIRGAGNVLGKEQHGHMDRVGYELYSKLLKEELGESILGQEIELDIKANAHIPDEYIESERGRMEAYKQIAEISSEADRLRVENSLVDSYGKIPLEVQSLIDIAWLKFQAEKLGVIKIVVSMHVGKLYLKNLDSLKDGKIAGRVPLYKGNVSLYFEENPILNFTTDSGKPKDFLKLMTEFISF